MQQLVILLIFLFTINMIFSIWSYFKLRNKAGPMGPEGPRGPKGPPSRLKLTCVTMNNLLNTFFKCLKNNILKIQNVSFKN